MEAGELDWLGRLPANKLNPQVLVRCGGHQHLTAKKKKTAEPVWTETFCFGIASVATDVLELEVSSASAPSCASLPLGTWTFGLQELVTEFNGSMQGWVPLCPPPCSPVAQAAVPSGWAVGGGSLQARIRLSVKFLPPIPPSLSPSQQDTAARGSLHPIHASMHCGVAVEEATCHSRPNQHNEERDNKGAMAAPLLTLLAPVHSLVDSLEEDCKEVIKDKSTPEVEEDCRQSLYTRGRGGSSVGLHSTPEVEEDCRAPQMTFPPQITTPLQTHIVSSSPTVTVVVSTALGTVGSRECGHPPSGSPLPHRHNDESVGEKDRGDEGFAAIPFAGIAMRRGNQDKTRHLVVGEEQRHDQRHDQRWGHAAPPLNPLSPLSCLVSPKLDGHKLKVKDDKLKVKDEIGSVKVKDEIGSDEIASDEIGSVSHALVHETNALQHSRRLTEMLLMEMLKDRYVSIYLAFNEVRRWKDQDDVALLLPLTSQVRVFVALSLGPCVLRGSCLSSLCVCKPC